METFMDWPLWQQILAAVGIAGWFVALIVTIKKKTPVVGPGGGGGGGGGGSGDDDEPDKPEVPI